MAKLADAADLKSAGAKALWGFDSPSRHQNWPAVDGSGFMPRFCWIPLIPSRGTEAVRRNGMLNFKAVSTFDQTVAFRLS